MAELYNIIFLLQFVAAVTITGYKLFNLMSSGQVYDIKVAFMLFIGYLLAYGVGMIVSILYVDEILVFILLQIEQLCLYLHILFIIAELFFTYRDRFSEVAQGKDFYRGR